MSVFQKCENKHSIPYIVLIWSEGIFRMKKLSWKITATVKRLQLEAACIVEQIPSSSSELVLKFF